MRKGFLRDMTCFPELGITLDFLAQPFIVDEQSKAGVREVPKVTHAAGHRAQTGTGIPPAIPPCDFSFTSWPPSPQSLRPLIKCDLTITLPHPSNHEVSILKHLAKGVKTPPTKHFLEKLIPNKAQGNHIRPPLKTCVKDKKVSSKAQSTS